MSATTIEWTQRPGTKGETWNPTTGCNKVSAGCKHCYAEVMHKRLRAMHQPKYQRAFSDGVVTHADTLTIPLQWKKPRTVFVNSMSDLFHADVPFAFIDQVFAIMALTPQHTYQILTKRPERMAEYFATRTSPRSAGSEAAGPAHPGSHKGPYLVVLLSKVTVPFKAEWVDGGDHPIPMVDVAFPLPNVWLGTSVENQATADERIPHLLRVPAAVRFLSCEPLLGPVDLRSVFTYNHVYEFGSHGKKRVYTDGRDRSPIHWLIAGGESGPNARLMHPDWPRSLRDQCAAAGVPFFFKQWGAYSPLENATTEYHDHDIHITPSGTKFQPGAFILKPGEVVMRNYGKHASGHLLDGREHQEYPSTVGTSPAHVTPGKASAPRPGVSPMQSTTT